MNCGASIVIMGVLSGVCAKPGAAVNATAMDNREIRARDFLDAFMFDRLTMTLSFGIGVEDRVLGVKFDR